MLKKVTGDITRGGIGDCIDATTGGLFERPWERPYGGGGGGSLKPTKQAVVKLLVRIG